MTDGPAVVWRRRDDVIWRRSLDAVILVPVDGDDPTTLAGGGPVVWDLLAEPATLSELVSVLVEAYGADPAVVERDVAALLTDLESLGAVTHT